MHKYDLNRVEFYSIDDLANGNSLSKAEPILRNEIQSVYDNINDVIELYNIKRHIDNELYLKIWTQEDIDNFKKKVNEYGKIVGLFMSRINDSNVINYYEQLLRGYIHSFWELVNSRKIYKQISPENFAIILSNEPHTIRTILTHKNIVSYYNSVLSDFLMNYPQSAEILISIYEEKRDFQNKEMYLPKNLTVQHKEDIISKYLDSEVANMNYFQLIQNARDKNDFKISPKTRLKAKQRYKEETERMFKEKNNGSFKYGVSVCFPEKMTEIKQGELDGSVCNYSYSLDFIKQNSDNYSLFRNFRTLFEYLDAQGRISLVNKGNDLSVLERVFGIHSQNEYRAGIFFKLAEMTSYAQIIGYNKVINDFGNTLENILQVIFTSIFQEKYNFASNAHIAMPPTNTSYIENVKLLAPEFESIIKQYKLFVEDGNIDFDLLQITSSPCTIKEIPSLEPNKYLYLKDDNQEIVACSNLFFSDQTSLAYVEPFKDKHYHCLFNLLVNEQVSYNNYEDYQKPKINYLIDKGLLFLDEKNFIQIVNNARVLILKDLRENEVASFYYYSPFFQKEAKEMERQNMIFFESSLFSKPEQRYFNYFLNKSEFTNGLDLRNRYLHGTQVNPKDTQRHEYAYFTYLKLLILAFLKIEDDLFISQVVKTRNNE